MKTWFVGTVKYFKTDEKGNSKKVTEPYLVDAVSFSETETRLYEELGSLINGEFEISDISRSNFADVFHYEDAEIWYKCRIVYMDIDEKSQKEKKVSKYMLVSAHTVHQAYERIEESLNTMIVPFEITNIIKSNYIEVFPYRGEGERKIPSNLRPLSELENQEA